MAFQKNGKFGLGGTRMWVSTICIRAENERGKVGWSLRGLTRRVDPLAFLFNTSIYY
jgi:hypothetical protein